ncbi:MAG: transposase, partial [Rikenellaceae bacterium]
MNLKFTLATLLTVAIIATSTAQTPLWNGKGRIAISSDGNEHDHDDWAATPLSLALIAAKGLQDKMVLYTYSDHVWGSNQEMPLTDEQKASNREKSKIRARVEHVFGFMEQTMQGLHLRSVGLERAKG